MMQSGGPVGSGAMGKRRRHHHSWWQDTTNGVKNWIAVIIVATLAIGVGALVVAGSASHRTASIEAGSYSPTPLQLPERRDVALFIGDSYSAGAGAASDKTRWTALAAAHFGWSEFNQALGGTGYVATAGTNGCGKEYCGTYTEAITDVSESARPTIIIISGGRNDGDRLTGAGDAVANTIRSASARWPSARIVVTSPLWDDNGLPKHGEDAVEVVRDAAASAGVTFLDLGQPLDGHPEMVIQDGVHPNDAGHAAIEDAFVAAWEQALPDES